MLGETVDPCLQSWCRWLSWLVVGGVGVFLVLGVWHAWGVAGVAWGYACIDCSAVRLSGYLDFWFSWRPVSDVLALATPQDSALSSQHPDVHGGLQR